MTRKQKRLAILGGFGLVLVSALALILTGLRDQIVFFRAPSEVVAGKVKPGEAFRLGGLVEQGSVQREPNQMVRFRVTDGPNTIAVTYQGLLPDLFREGQGVVAEGKLDASGAFTASTVLARHDENYMPREVADALKKQGHWQPGKAEGAPKP
ncbi:MAG: cytochrome c maturation protein CcmE [Beijerinckiaceae bacterium]|jgi:cytochrome c-type biogenesis protein CcmE|nr:cytochrome c maturation protein CcmE [Beijerinckiaceae bacterium]